MQTDSWKVNGKSSVKMNASLDSVNELRHICMAWVEAGASVNYANEWSCQSVFAIASGFDESFPQEE